jgi:hypothetical protein
MGILPPKQYLLNYSTTNIRADEGGFACEYIIIIMQENLKLHTQWDYR